MLQVIVETQLGHGTFAILKLKVGFTAVALMDRIELLLTSVFPPDVTEKSVAITPAADANSRAALSLNPEAIRVRREFIDIANVLLVRCILRAPQNSGV